MAVAASTTVVLMIGSDANATAHEVKAGVAYEPFVLPAHVPLAGYSKRHGRPSSGVRDPVGVRALVVSDGETTAALVSADLLIVDEQLAAAVRARLTAEGVPAAFGVMLAATHTHSGPGAYGHRFLEKLSMGHFDPAVFDAIVEAVVRAVLRARATLAPVRVSVQRAATSGLVENRVDPGGLADAEVTVVTGFHPGERTPFLILVNFSAHPTTLGAWNRALSADYPGVVVRELERRIPGVVAMFVVGSVGDQAPVKSGDRDERAERVGHPLAEQVVALLATARPEAPEGVRAMQTLMPLPPARLRLGRVLLPSWLGRPLVDDDATLSLLQVGRIIFFGVPCDLTAGLGAELKDAARARGLEPVVVGFADDYIGYCVPAALYAAKQYESAMAFNGPNTGELVVAELKRLLSELVME